MRFLIIVFISLIFGFFASCIESNSNKSNEIVNEKEELGKGQIEALAFTYYKNRDYKKAIIYLNQLIEKDSLNGDYFYKRAISFGRLIDKVNSIKDFNNSIRLNHRIDDSYFGIAMNYAFDNDSLCLLNLTKTKAANPSFEDIDNEIAECKRRMIVLRGKH